jgi:hypothetical protein
MTTAPNLRRLADNPKRDTIFDTTSVNIEKLMINPVITPRGRALLLAVEEDKTMGKMGRMHGESTVTRPDNAAKRIRIIIMFPLSLIYLIYCQNLTKGLNNY